MTDNIADYGDFKIFLKPDGMTSKELRDGASKMTLEATRRQKMFDNGILSKTAYKAYEQAQTLNLATLYAKYILEGWEGEFIGEELGEFTAEKAAAILGKEENAALFLDLIEVAKVLAEKQNEIDEAEIKN